MTPVTELETLLEMLAEQAQAAFERAESCNAVMRLASDDAARERARIERDWERAACGSLLDAVERGRDALECLRTVEANAEAAARE